MVADSGEEGLPLAAQGDALRVVRGFCSLDPDFRDLCDLAVFDTRTPYLHDLTIGTDHATIVSMPNNLRIVFEHTEGPFAGLFQIGGHSDEFAGQPLPSILAGFTALGRQVASAKMVKINERYVHYREQKG